MRLFNRSASFLRKAIRDVVAPNLVSPELQKELDLLGGITREQGVSEKYDDKTKLLIDMLPRLYDRKTFSFWLMVYLFRDKLEISCIQKFASPNYIFNTDIFFGGQMDEFQPLRIKDKKKLSNSSFPKIDNPDQSGSFYLWQIIACNPNNRYTHRGSSLLHSLVVFKDVYDTYNYFDFSGEGPQKRIVTRELVEYFQENSFPSYEGLSYRHIFKPFGSSLLNRLIFYMDIQ